MLHRKAEGEAQSANGAPPIVHDVPHSPGHALDATTRAFFEPRFGADFSAVRVHTDSSVAESASAVNALAYMVGRDIVFGAGQYAPATREGQRLLAHELTHVVQQRGVAPAAQLASVSRNDDPLEREADQAARSIDQGSIASVQGTTNGVVQRSPAWNSQTLEIELEPIDPTAPPQMWYTENGFLSQRMSDNLPVYRGPFCQNSLLPFRSNVTFRVDYADEARPQPFTAPSVSVKFEFSPARGGFTISKSDSSPAYMGKGKPLQTNFGQRFDMTLDNNGPFHMYFELKDPDTGITRVYDDTIQIEAKRPCA